MQTTWREESSGEVVFEWVEPLGPRLIAAALFGFVGLFFFVHLARALIIYTRSASAAEWLAAVPGLLLVTVLFAVPSAFAAYLALGRSRVVIDKTAGEIRDTRYVRLIEWSWTSPIEDATDVRVETRVIKTSRRRYRSWAVRICVANRKRPITVGYEDVTVDADALAKRVKETLGLE